jgi:ornithine carbamoyltransferase
VNEPLHRNLLALSPLADPAARTLLAVARALQHSGSETTPLRGKNIALICGKSAAGGARLFADAATRLGARVARIEPAPAWLQGESQPGADTARLLGHLYDAVDCEALPAGFAARLQSLLEVPVYDSLARENHPIFDLLSALVPAGRMPTAADRCTLVQAALVSTLL